MRQKDQKQEMCDANKCTANGRRWNRRSEEFTRKLVYTAVGKLNFGQESGLYKQDYISRTIYAVTRLRLF